MALDKHTVARVARLARIKVEPNELDGLAAEVSGILGWIEQLNEVDTNGVEPMARVVTMQLPMRDDVATEPDRHQAVLRNAAGHTDRFFTVPKVVE